MLLFWLTASPAAQLFSERQLGFHHLLHWLQFGSGIVLAANLRVRPFRGFGRVAAAAVAGALAYVLVVHLPWPLDRAAALPPLHAAVHLGFALAGVLVGLAWRDVGELARVVLVVATMGAMTVLSLAEISGAFAYSAYPPGQEAASGIVMLAGMGVFWVALAFTDLPARLSRRSRPRVALALVAGLALLLLASYLLA